ncbi:hypothetical protein H0H93_007030 [Arthromyces matolae]|nr:hypothetical protein H0H93_007030 [Arthromyces matolae]
MYWEETQVKVEPSSADLHNIPLAPPTTSSQLPDGKLPDQKKPTNPEVPLHSIPSIPEARLTQLEVEANNALIYKQTLLFKDLQTRIGGFRRSHAYNVQSLTSEQELALKIYDDLEQKWKQKDEQDTVFVKTEIPPPVFQFAIDWKSWNPLIYPSLLPPILQGDPALQPEGNTRPIFKVQRLLDLGNAYINWWHDKDNIHPDDRVIIGYQLILMAAVEHLRESRGRERDPSTWLLYLIRDAEYTPGISPYLKQHLEKFDKDLTAFLKENKNLDRELPKAERFAEKSGI